MLADIELQVALPAAKSVPDDAVVDTGREQIVFVEREAGVFERRLVETGAHADGLVQITRGLNAGEKVAVGANFLLDSDTRLRAGHD
jgi:Cu(I)/Ag(I) efflux system membrane fusion protein